MGVSHSDFWQMTPRIFRATQEGFKQRMHFDQQRANLLAWVQGIYFQHAVAAAVDKKSHYPKEPFNVEPPLSPEEKATRDHERLKAYLQNFAAQHNAQWRQKHPEEHQNDN